MVLKLKLYSFRAYYKAGLHYKIILINNNAIVCFQILNFYPLEFERFSKILHAYFVNIRLVLKFNFTPSRYDAYITNHFLINF